MRRRDDRCGGAAVKERWRRRARLVVRGPARPTREQVERRRWTAVALALLVFAGSLGMLHALTSRSSAHPRAASVRATQHRARPARVTAAQAQRDAVARAAQQGVPILSADGAHREVALTFDDGPGPDTRSVLAVLRRHQAPATFFVVGVNVTRFPLAMRDLVASGLPIGDHTFDHPNLTLLSLADQAREIGQDATAIASAGAPRPTLFRPPYRAFDDTTARVLRTDRMLSVLWSVDSEDYLRPGADRILANILSAVRPGGIVLMHDGGGQRAETVAALRRLIPALRHAGYRLVTVPQLLADQARSAHGDTPRTGASRQDPSRG